MNALKHEVVQAVCSLDDWGGVFGNVMPRFAKIYISLSLLPDFPYLNHTSPLFLFKGNSNSLAI